MMFYHHIVVNSFFFKAIFSLIFMYFIQHHPSDSTVSEDAGNRDAVRRSNNSVRSHPCSARSHLHSARSHHTRLDLIYSVLSACWKHSKHSKRQCLNIILSIPPPFTVLMIHFLYNEENFNSDPSINSTLFPQLNVMYSTVLVSLLHSSFLSKEAAAKRR